MRRLLTVALLTVHFVVHSQETRSNPSPQCVRPPPGQFANACTAIEAATLYQSKHVGDQWIDCEDMGGSHGTAGYGVAVFFASEGRPYWHEEIRAQFNTLKQIASKPVFARVQKEQRNWERNLPRSIARAQKQVGGEGGTLAMYVGEGNAMLVVRRRALILACMVEQLQQPKE